MVNPVPTALTQRFRIELPVRALHAAVTISLAAGCAGGTETGNPPLEAKLSYAAHSSAPDAIGVRTPGATATVEAVWLVLDAVRFTPGAGCDGSEAGGFEAPGIGVGDHASGNAVTTSFELEEGSYCAVRVPLSLASELPVDAPAELEASSLLVVGALADDTPFSIRSVAAEPFVLLPEEAAFTLSEGSADSLVGFDVALWLTGLDFGSADVTNARIEISPESNQALLARFESNLERGVTLYRDRDADGRLDQNPERLARTP